MEEGAAVEREAARRVGGSGIDLGGGEEGVIARLLSRVRGGRWTAAMMRGYVPQRQMLPFMLETIWDSVGVGVALSSAVARMIMPEVQ